MAVVQITEAVCAPEGFSLWDSVWSPADGFADWKIASAAEIGNAGGLQSQNAIATAVTLALFTDRRLPADHPLAYLADRDARGWWGDGVEINADDGEDALGSLLWLLERAPLTVSGISIATWAEQFAREALAPIVRQGAAVRVDAAATVYEIGNRLELVVSLYGRDGNKVFDRKFDLLWNQVTR